MGLPALILPVVALGVSMFGPADPAPPRPLAPGDELPRLEGEFLTGRKAVLPDAAHGRVALLMLGFSYESRHAVEAWAREFRPEFQANPAVTFFEVPMLGGGARLARWFIDSGMRRGTPKELHEQVVTVYGGTDRWKALVGVKDPDVAYLVLLDAGGRVRWTHAGAFDPHAFDLLKQEVEAALAAAG